MRRRSAYGITTGHEGGGDVIPTWWPPTDSGLSVTLTLLVGVVALVLGWWARGL